MERMKSTAQISDKRSASKAANEIAHHIHQEVTALVRAEVGFGMLGSVSVG